MLCMACHVMTRGRGGAIKGSPPQPTPPFLSSFLPLYFGGSFGALHSTCILHGEWWRGLGSKCVGLDLARSRGMGVVEAWI